MNKVSLDTMACVGKKKNIAGKEYRMCPVTIEDMHYIFGDGDDKLFIPEKKAVDNKEVPYQVFGYNIVNESKKATLMKILKKYVTYNDTPVTEQMIIEHGWTFKDIADFLYFWMGEVSE